MVTCSDFYCSSVDLSSRLELDYGAHGKGVEVVAR